MSHGRFNDPVSAALAGVKDIFRGQALRDHLSDADRLEGRTCLVTGANRGLGLAVAAELARRLTRDGRPEVEVNVICPGPVNTDIIREAPLALRRIFTLFFQPPAKAALPLAYMAASPELAGRTNLYLHMFNPKRMDPKVYDAAAGARLWAESARVWAALDPRAARHGLRQDG